MQKEQIVAIAVRLFAIFLVVYAFRHASSMLPLTNYPPPQNISYIFIASATLPLLLAALLLWIFPLTIAAKLLPRSRRTESAGALSATEIQAVAFSILGLWVLTTAVPDIFYWITYVYVMKNGGVDNSAFSPNLSGRIGATVVELVIGIWLLFGARGLTGLLRLARTAGRYNK